MASDVFGYVHGDAALFHDEADTLATLCDDDLIVGGHVLLHPLQFGAQHPEQGVYGCADVLRSVGRRFHG